MKPTVHFGDETTGASVFFDRYVRAAAALTEAGIGAGDVVALALRNEPVLLELMLAARWLGARWCMINWHFKAGEVRHILSDSGAKVLVVHADLFAQMRDGVPDSVRVFAADPLPHTRVAFALDDAALHAARALERWDAFRDGRERPPARQGTPGTAMLYTSGTTGLPKGIRRNAATPEQAQLAIEMCRTALGIEPGMRTLVSAPLYHAAPVSYIVMAALHDAQIWIEPRFDAEATLRLIEAQRITHAYLVPTMFQRLLRLPPEVRSRHDLSPLRFVASTGSPCAAQIKHRMIEWLGAGDP